MRYYKCLNANEFEYRGYKIVPVREKDIMKIKDWRNKQIDILRQKGIITSRMQSEYFNNIIFPDFKADRPKQIIFSILFKNRLIGYGGLVYINWKDRRGEVSFLLNPLRVKSNEQYKKDFSAFLKLIKQVAYAELNFNRLFTETFDFRKNHIKILEKNNFRLEGRMKKHVLINNKCFDSLIHGNLREYERF